MSLRVGSPVIPFAAGPGRQGEADEDARSPHGAAARGPSRRICASGAWRPVGLADTWRLRVRDWRVIFERDEAIRVIGVVRVLPRGRAYDR
jgi:ParE toxin of type II toxin-antitoxin system, parDE